MKITIWVEKGNSLDKEYIKFQEVFDDVLKAEEGLKILVEKLQKITQNGV